jgi:hypothetical protein
MDAFVVPRFAYRDENPQELKSEVQMNEWPHSERRKFPRTSTAVQLELRLDSSNIPMRAQTTDICEIGCYVEMNITLELGSHLSVALWLGDEKIIAEGEVVTRHPQFGNGIQLGMSVENRGKLARYLESITKNES